MKIAYFLLNLAYSTNVFNNLGFMRSVSKRIPDQVRPDGLSVGLTTESGRLSLIKKRAAAETKTVIAKDLADCSLTTKRRRKRLVCQNQPSKAHYGINVENTLFKNIKLIIND